MTAELLEDVTLRMPMGRSWAFDDLPGLPDDGRRYEIIDGSLHVSPAPSMRHQRAAGRLSHVLDDAAPDGFEAVEAVSVDFGRSALQPDIVVARVDVFDRGGSHLLPVDVQLAVEVVSPSSVRMDRLVKPSVLAQARVPAYWRVELDGPGTPLIVVNVLHGDVYREVVTVRAGEATIVDVPFQVELRPAELAGQRRKG